MAYIGEYPPGVPSGISFCNSTFRTVAFPVPVEGLIKHRESHFSTAIGEPNYIGLGVSLRI